MRMTRGRSFVGCLALAVSVSALGAAVAGARLTTAGPPREVQTGAARRTPNGFKLSGKLNPDGAPTTYYFIYKPAGAAECEDLEGCGPHSPTGGPLAGGIERGVAPIEVTGLTAGKTYIYWLVARNAHGVAVGRQLTFTAPA
jgi:hypothetical protein